MCQHVADPQFVSPLHDSPAVCAPSEGKVVAVALRHPIVRAQVVIG